MNYFKTALPVNTIKTSLDTAMPGAEKDTCIVEIENKKSIIVSISESISDYLKKDRNFRNIQLTDTDISIIKIIHKISSVSGNRKLFGL